MYEELHQAALLLRCAKAPEDVFGELTGEKESQLAQASQVYRALARSTHVDPYPDDLKPKAHTAFTDLGNWYERAKRKIKSGTYGSETQDEEPVAIKAKRYTYLVGREWQRNASTTLYHCTFGQMGDEARGIFKLAQKPADNAGMLQEAKAVTRLFNDEDRKQFLPYIPELVESFGYNDGSYPTPRLANVFTYREEFYSLAEIKAAYPDGVDTKDMAWMFRRALVALGFVHRNDLIHGAILPENLLIHPEEHGLNLWDWTHSVTDSGRVLPLPAYIGWYPKEVTDKGQARPATDIAMAARCMIYLLGGDPVTGHCPSSVPRQVQAFFKGCLLPLPEYRPADAWELKEEFDELLERLYGPRKFRPFAMPKK